MKYFLPKTVIDVIILAILVGAPTATFVSKSTLVQKTIKIFAVNPTDAREENTKEVVVAINPFENIILTAKAAAVFDVKENKFIFAKNATEALPLASLTKLMTSAVALEEASAKTPVTITANDLAQDGDSGLRPGETWSLKNLIDFMLVVSSNDGAKAVASAIEAFQPETFVSKMNGKAASLGLSTMRFQNPTGLDQSESEAGGYSSAADLAKFFAYMVKNHSDVLEATKESRITVASDETIHSGQNTDTIINALPGLFGSKTGYTDLAGGNLAVAIDAGPNHPYILVVLGSTYEDRFNDIKNLASSTFAYLALEN